MFSVDLLIRIPKKANLGKVKRRHNDVNCVKNNVT